MIEIAMVIVGTRQLREDAVRMGRSPWWAALFPIFWLGFELMGALVAFLLGFEGFAVFVIALLSAIVGGVIAMTVVGSLRPVPAAQGELLGGLRSPSSETMGAPTLGQPSRS